MRLAEALPYAAVNTPDDPPADQCYRCGYDLRGVADDQPCTECGLLAARSRRPSDELHHTRPGWLRRMSVGVWLILAAGAIGAVWPFAATYVRREIAFSSRQAGSFIGHALWQHGLWLGADVAALLLLAGVWLLTSREGYEPADRRDAWRRRLLRAFAFVPLVALGIQHAATQVQLNATNLTRWGWYASTATTIFLLLTLGLVPLPLLLWFQLRSLARRARSAHLAEHCAIVGIGNAATLLYVPVLYLVTAYATSWGLGMYWSSRSTASLVLMLALGVASLLFALWNVYLLIRFAVAFAAASRKLRQAWRRDDRSAPAW